MFTRLHETRGGRIRDFHAIFVFQGGGAVSNCDHLEDAARALILEWVDKLFSERISSYRGLALFLIDKMYVDTQSAAAQALAASVAREHEAIDGGTFILN